MKKDYTSLGLKLFANDVDNNFSTKVKTNMIEEIVIKYAGFKWIKIIASFKTDPIFMLFVSLIKSKKAKPEAIKIFIENLSTIIINMSA